MSMDKSADDIEKRTSRRRLLRQMARRLPRLYRSLNGSRFLPGHRDPHDGLTSRARNQHLSLHQPPFRLRMISFWTILNAAVSSSSGSKPIRRPD